MFLFLQIETPAIFTFVCCIKTLLDSVMSCTMQHDILRVTFSIALTGSSGKTSVSGTRKWILLIKYRDALSLSNAVSFSSE